MCQTVSVTVTECEITAFQCLPPAHADHSVPIRWLFSSTADYLPVCTTYISTTCAHSVGQKSSPYLIDCLRHSYSLLFNCTVIRTGQHSSTLAYIVFCSKGILLWGLFPYTVLILYLYIQGMQLCHCCCLFHHPPVIPNWFIDSDACSCNKSRQIWSNSDCDCKFWLWIDWSQ